MGEARRTLLMLIGEVKEIAPARFGHRLVVKHLPKFPLMLNDDLQRRLSAKFANKLSLWGAMPEAHLIAIATFGLEPTGVASIESIALMIVNDNWIPFENSYDAALLDALTRERASFLKGLRYNLSLDRPLASVVLREDDAAPVAMYVVPPTPTKLIGQHLKRSRVRARWRLGFGTPASMRCLRFRSEPGGGDDRDADVAELARGIVTGGRDGKAGLESGSWSRLEPDRPMAGRAR